MSFFSRGLKQTFTTKVIKGSKTYFIFINFLYFINKYFKFTRPTINRIFYKLSNKPMIIKNKIGKFYVNTNDDTIPHSSPIFEEQYHDWLKSNKPGLFLDIGANIGFYTILALNKYNYSGAITFEANKDINSVLEKNLSLNKHKEKTQIFNLALGEKKQKVIFKINKFRTGLSSVKWRDNSKFDENTYKEIEVDLDVFDSIVNKNKLSVEDISFIKIDVEGSELDVLKGMKKSLNSFEIGTKLFIEILDKNNDKKEIIKILKNSNFKEIKRNSRNYLFLKEK